MKYLNPDTLCLESFEYVKTPGNPDGLVPETTYEKQKQRGTIKVHGRGGNGRTVLIEYESLPEPYKKLVCERFGDPYEYASRQPLRNLIRRIDIKAIEFFDRYVKPNGKELEPKLRLQYIKAAQVMRMIDYVYANKRWLKKELHIELTRFWDVVGTLSETKAAGLPSSARHLRPLYERWKTNSYAGLISGKVGNTNRLKATADVVNMVLSLYTDKQKPYAIDVYEYYKDWLAGKVHLVDDEGEILEPADFPEISRSTILTIIKDNVETVDKLRLTAKEFNDRHRPYNRRHSPNYAFSKLTMDDRSIPFKLKDGTRIWAYYIADVASKCIVGKAFARSNDDGSGKDRALFKASMVDMFRLIISNGWGMPAEIEVEHHISNTFIGKTNDDGTVSPDLLTDGFLYKYVTFCNAANPQQKRAEHIFRGIKYQKERDIKGFIGRFYARIDSNRTTNDAPVYKYTYDALKDEMNAAINSWNNDLHHDQKKYPGLTRWQVLQQNRNPELITPHMPSIMRYVGKPVATRVNRTQVEAFNNEYIVPVNAGLHNGEIVTAYAIPGNEIPEVYLYQNECYLCTAVKKGSYNEAKAERTDEDVEIMKRQNAHTAQFDAAIKKRVSSLKKLRVVKAEKLPEQTPDDDTGQDQYRERNPREYADVDEEYWSRKAMEDL